MAPPDCVYHKDIQSLEFPELLFRNAVGIDHVGEAAEAETEGREEARPAGKENAPEVETEEITEENKVEEKSYDEVFTENVAFSYKLIFMFPKFLTNNTCKFE